VLKRGIRGCYRLLGYWDRDWWRCFKSTESRVSALGWSVTSVLSIFPLMKWSPTPASSHSRRACVSLRVRWGKNPPHPLDPILPGKAPDAFSPPGASPAFPAVFPFRHELEEPTFSDCGPETYQPIDGADFAPRNVVEITYYAEARLPDDAQWSLTLHGPWKPLDFTEESRSPK